MKRFLCWFFGHRTYAGISKKMSIAFMCPRCKRMVAGGFAVSPSKRK